MLADTPDVDGPARKARFQPEERPDEGVLGDGSVGLPVARMGLEHEFFLVDRSGESRDLADLFLRECREVAQAEGLDPRCFKAESVMGMVEITTPPTYGVGEMTAHYLDNLGLALGVASELGLALYPLGTYPLPIGPVIREDPGYAVRAGIIGQDWFSHAGRCAGAHLHLELPAGTVWPDVKAALRAPGAAERVRRERLEVRPGRGVLAVEPDGDLLHVPTFSYLNGELLCAAVTSGLLDPRVEAYVDSLVRFASPYLEVPELVGPLGTSGYYKNTESEILASFPHLGASLTRAQGLSLVREVCGRMHEQVSSLRRRYEGAPPGDQQGPGVARVVYIRESPIVLADGMHPAGADEERATAGAADKELV